MAAATHDRRFSWKMDGVQRGSWDSLSDEERRIILQQQFGIPREVSVVVGQSGENAQIVVNLQELERWSLFKPLYEDVEGEVPAGHVELTERDEYNIPYGPLDHQKEMERALQLSKKPFANAPSWTKELPWDDMEGITLEEFIIYFPNHIARWPALALYLRHRRWDRLFYRTARLINLARGSHHAENRNNQHVEILPLMMKVQQAIQELDPGYMLVNHSSYEELLTDEWFHAHWHDKPANFPRDGIAGTATLEEAAGYLTGVNIFQDRPFSTRMWNMQPVGPRFPFAEAFGEGRPATQHQTEPCEQQSAQPAQTKWHDVDETPTGWINTETNQSVTLDVMNTSPRSNEIVSVTQESNNADPNANIAAPSNPTPNTGDTPPVERCAQYEDCDDVDCTLQHAHNDTEADLIAWQTEERKKIRKRNQICSNLPTCFRGWKCVFLHPGDQEYAQALVNSDATQQLARTQGEGASGSQEQGQQQGANQQQQLQGRNTQQEEGRNNPQQQGQDNRQQQGRNDQRQQGQSNQRQQGQNNQQQKGQNNQQQLNPNMLRALCRHGANCNNQNCPFGHRSPAADENVAVRLDQSCKFGAGCTSSRCNRTHPSPASAEPNNSGAGGGGNTGGQPRGGGHGGRGENAGQGRGAGRGDNRDSSNGSDRHQGHGSNQEPQSRYPLPRRGNAHQGNAHQGTGQREDRGGRGGQHNRGGHGAGEHGHQGRGNGQGGSGNQGSGPGRGRPIRTPPRS